jgi:hypothetical protein
MSQDANLVMKKMLQKIAVHILTSKEYKDFDEVDIYFAFTSKHKTAMCQTVYGMKIYTKAPYSMRDSLVKDFQMSIRKVTDKMMNQSVCCTDIIFERNYD